MSLKFFKMLFPRYKTVSLKFCVPVLAPDRMDDLHPSRIESGRFLAELGVNQQPQQPNGISFYFYVKKNKYCFKSNYFMTTYNFRITLSSLNSI